MKNIKAGFTLIELLIVIAIIGILAAVLVPNLLNARKAANDTAAQSTLRNAVTAAEAWSSSNGGKRLALTQCQAIVGGTIAAGQNVTACSIVQDANTTYGTATSSSGKIFEWTGSTMNVVTTAPTLTTTNIGTNSYTP